jgi:hypothetical protein
MATVAIVKGRIPPTCEPTCVLSFLVSSPLRSGRIVGLSRKGNAAQSNLAHALAEIPWAEREQFLTPDGFFDERVAGNLATLPIAFASSLARCCIAIGLVISVNLRWQYFVDRLAFAPFRPEDQIGRNSPPEGCRNELRDRSGKRGLGL